LFFFSIFGGCAFFASSTARASALCDEYRSKSPTLYAIYCKEDSAGLTKPAGANSTFSDSFNISSASLPTEPSSYGIETIGSELRSGGGGFSPNFALIKGYHRFGTGISTGSNNTFYGDDVIERLSGPPNVTSFKPAEPATGHFTNLNLGGSLELLTFGQGNAVKLGASVRYNETTNTWGGGPAVFLNLGNFSFGAGFTNETVSALVPRVLFTTFLVSARVSNFEFEYTYLTDNLNLGLSPIQIFTATATYGRFLLLAAIRQLNYLTNASATNVTGEVYQEHFGVQWLVSTHFSVGYLFNYIPGANSVGLQVYL
jgi:hypothetical protein